MSDLFDSFWPLLFACFAFALGWVTRGRIGK